MRRFLIESTTPLATGMACVCMSVLFAIGEVTFFPILSWVFPAKAELVFTSPLEPAIYRALFAFILSLPPALGWTLAAVRGYRRKERSDTRTWAILSAQILAATAAAMVFRIFWIRSAIASEQGPFAPMLTVGSIDHWRFGLYAALLMTALLAFSLRRQRR
jgi:hypothetical protein